MRARVRRDARARPRVPTRRDARGRFLGRWRARGCDFRSRETLARAKIARTRRRDATRATTRDGGARKNSLDGTDARESRNGARDDASDGETDARGNFERSRRAVIRRDDDDAGRRQRHRTVAERARTTE